MKCLLLFAVVLIGCIPAAPGHATRTIDGRLTSETGVQQHWVPDDFPISVLVDERMPSEFVRAVTKACTHWNRRVGDVVFIPVVTPTPIERRGSIVVTDASLGYDVKNRKILGLTHNVFNVQSGRVVFSSFYLDPECGISARAVAVHELGHALGLGHDEDPDSIMFEETRPFGQQIEWRDIEIVREQLGALTCSP